MKFKTCLAGLGLALVGMGAHAVEGSFASSAASYTKTFSSGAGELSLSVTAPFTGKAGYDIFSVLLDGMGLTDLNPGKSDDYEYTGLIDAGLHTIVVTGKSYGGQFSGAFEVTPVPEPGSLALVLAGLGVVAGVVRRRLR